MDLAKNLQDAFEYTKAMTTDHTRWLLLMVLNLVPIVNLIILGYAAKIIEETPRSDTPPILSDYVNVWMRGLKVAVAALIYGIVPTILFAVGGMMLGLGLATFFVGELPFWEGRARFHGFSWVSLPMAGLGGILILAGMAALFLTAIVAAMGIVHMIKNDQFEKAFAFSEITGIIGGIGWADYIVWFAVVFVIALFFGTVREIPLIGWLLGAIVTPLYMIFLSRSAGLVYGERHSTE